MLKMPITTLSEDKVLGLDSLALFIGLIAIMYFLWFLLYKIITKLNRNFLSVQMDKSVVFSLLYLSAITILDTFYTSNLRGTNIWSMNRHLLSTPFFVVFLIWLSNKKKFHKAELYMIGWIAMITLAASSLYRYPSTLLLQFLLYPSLFISLLLNVRKIYFIALYCVSIIIQVYFIYGYISGSWLG